MVETGAEALGLAYCVMEPHWGVWVYALRRVGYGVRKFGSAVSGWVGDVLVSPFLVMLAGKGDANLCA